jgi:hypothetical protein
LGIGVVVGAEVFEDEVHAPRARTETTVDTIMRRLDLIISAELSHIVTPLLPDVCL